MRLERELGSMKLDADGVWIDHPVSNSSFAKAPDSSPSSLPPAIPGEWIELAARLPQELDTPALTAVETSGDPVEVDARHADLKKEANHAK
jgi:hypothetical protein